VYVAVVADEVPVFTSAVAYIPILLLGTNWVYQLSKWPELFSLKSIVLIEAIVVFLTLRDVARCDERN